MWSVLTIIATASLVISFSKGRNAIWGGATAGLLIALVVALTRSPFDWSIILKGVVIGVLVGVAAETLGRLSDVTRGSD